MKLVTWNVNSLKVRMPRTLELLAQLQPDVASVSPPSARRARIATPAQRPAEWCTAS